MVKARRASRKGSRAAKSRRSKKGGGALGLPFYISDIAKKYGTTKKMINSLPQETKDQLVANAIASGQRANIDLTEEDVASGETGDILTQIARDLKPVRDAIDPFLSFIPYAGPALSLANSALNAYQQAHDPRLQEGYLGNANENHDYPGNTLNPDGRPEMMLGQSTEDMQRAVTSSGPVYSSGPIYSSHHGTTGAGIMERKLPGETRVNNRSRRGIVAERMGIRDHHVMANAQAITHGTPLDPGDVDAIPHVQEARKKVIMKAGGLRAPRKITKKGGTTYTSLKNTLITPGARV